MHTTLHTKHKTDLCAISKSIAMLIFFQRKKIVGQNIALIRKVVQWIERNVKIPLDNFEKKMYEQNLLIKTSKTNYVPDSINSEHC